MPYRYQNTEKTKSNSGVEIFQNSVYPDIPLSENDNYVITTMGDRLDILAQKFYGDVSFWWVIASANAIPGDSLYPPLGIQLRLPSNAKDVFMNYREFNLNR